MKIFGFNFSKRTLVIGLIIIVVIFISSMASKVSKQRELDERIKAQQESLQAAKNQTVAETKSLTQKELIQKSLRERYGEPPEGFEWDYAGNLVALGDDEMSYEDIVYTYIRSLSILDFSTAQRYASVSKVANTYNNYYGVASAAVANYYKNFLRKQYKHALTTLELNSIEDIAVFPDGEVIVTVKISVLDLSDKDFWEKDRLELFETILVYDETESDSVKKEQYIYDYVYKCYEDGTIGKREVIIEIVVGKENNGGWLISDDSELNFYLKYENGVDVANYILNQYSTWSIQKKLQEIKDNANK